MGKYKNAEDRQAGHAAFMNRVKVHSQNRADRGVDPEHIPLAINFGIHADLHAMETLTGFKKGVLVNFSSGRMSPNPEQQRKIIAAAKDLGWEVAPV